MSYNKNFKMPVIIQALREYCAVRLSVMGFVNASISSARQDWNYYRLSRT